MHITQQTVVKLGTHSTTIYRFCIYLPTFLTDQWPFAMYVHSRKHVQWTGNKIVTSQMLSAQFAVWLRRHQRRAILMLILLFLRGLMIWSPYDEFRSPRITAWDTWIFLVLLRGRCVWASRRSLHASTCRSGTLHNKHVVVYYRTFIIGRIASKFFMCLYLFSTGSCSMLFACLVRKLLSFS